MKSYSFDKEFEFNKMARFRDPLDRIKLNLFRGISKFVDLSYATAKKSGLIRLWRSF